MQETSEKYILELVEKQKQFFATHRTKDVEFRLKQLRKFLVVIEKYESEINEALWQDLHKSPEETYLTEISVVIHEIKFHLRNLRHWAKTKRVSTPFHLWPSSGKIWYQPLGVSLIIAPWNYPFNLTLNPLVGAISAGCCAILKPSPDAPATAQIMEKMIAECFDSNYITMVQGGRETNTHLLKQSFDMIFFSGSPKVGKVVMKAAAEHLTPVVLELGGKSPCIVDKSANIEVAARRIIWGKLLNAGQTCIAPDYLYVHKEVESELLTKIRFHIQKMFGENPMDSRFYGRIVNERAFQRLASYLRNGTVHTGGEFVESERYIAPTILTDVNVKDEVMQDEIFGPILPVFTFTDISEPLEYIASREKPLAFYYFGKSKSARKILEKSTSGGGCINDTVMNFANKNLPFGGVGNSGLNNYHGYDSFIAFTNRRAVVTNPTWIDLPMKYSPYKFFKWVRKIV